MSTEPHAPNTEEDIHRIARGFQASRILLTAVELGVFTAIADGATDSATVADTIKSHPRGTERLLDALTALGLLVKEGTQYANTPASARYLTRTSPTYISSIHHLSSLWESWSDLTESVRAGTRTQATSNPMKPEEREASFIEAMHHRAKPGADAMIARYDTGMPRRLLDIGGGSGVYSMAFLRAYPGLQATILDLPSVIERTKHYAAKEGLASRMEFLPGDLRTSDLGGPYDAIFISAIIHMLSGEEIGTLFRRCAAALTERGKLIVVDFFLEESRTTPPRAAVFSLNMLVATAKGDTYTEREVRRWMTEAGLAAIQRAESQGNPPALIASRV